jgi:NADH:ubiquinone oxidoreductase subunit K
MIPLDQVLLVALLHLLVGGAGMLMRRPALDVLICGVVGAAGALLVFAAGAGQPGAAGQVEGLVLMAVLVSVAAVGGAVIFCFHRFRRTVVLDEQNRLRE